MTDGVMGWPACELGGSCSTFWSVLFSVTSSEESAGSIAVPPMLMLELVRG